MYESTTVTFSFPFVCEQTSLDFTYREMFPPVTAHHNMLVREDNKIESQNKKVRAAHGTLTRSRAKIDDLTDARDHTIPSNTLSKALKSLEKSNEAFEKAVGEGLS